MSDGRPVYANNAAAYDATIIADLKGCSRLEICIGLYEHETAQHRFETWPAIVQKMVEDQLLSWGNSNKAAKIIAVTTAVVARQCLLVVHHRAS